MQYQVITHPEALCLMDLFMRKEGPTEFKKHFFVSVEQILDFVNTHEFVIVVLFEGSRNEIIGRRVLDYLFELAKVIKVELVCLYELLRNFVMVLSR